MELYSFFFILFCFSSLQTLWKLQMKDTNLIFVSLIKFSIIRNSITCFSLMQRRTNFPFDLLLKLIAHNKFIFWRKIKLSSTGYFGTSWTGLSNLDRFWFHYVCFYVFFRTSFQLINQAFHLVIWQPLTAPPNVMLCQSIFLNSSALDFGRIKHHLLYTKCIHIYS